MAHIDPTNKTDHAFAAVNTKPSKSNTPDTFETAFSKALDKTEGPDEADTGPHALKEIASKELTIMNSSDSVSNRTDTLLGMLDSYSAKLEDPHISLKHMAPILEKIKEGAEKLLRETQQLTDADAPLKKIATQTIVTAQTEYLKFQRGDYLS